MPNTPFHTTACACSISGADEYLGDHDENGLHEPAATPASPSLAAGLGSTTTASPLHAQQDGQDHWEQHQQQQQQQQQQLMGTTGRDLMKMVLSPAGPSGRTPTKPRTPKLGLSGAPTRNQLLPSASAAGGAESGELAPAQAVGAGTLAATTPGGGASGRFAAERSAVKTPMGGRYGSGYDSDGDSNPPTPEASPPRPVNLSFFLQVLFLFLSFETLPASQRGLTP